MPDCLSFQAPPMYGTCFIGVLLDAFNTTEATLNNNLCSKQRATD